MAQTVIGFFDDAADAQKAVDRLESIGISRDNVDISTRAETGTSNVSDDNDNESGITRFFKSLFGDDDSEADRYSKVGQNSTIVTVHAQSDDQAERVADLLDDCGAINVDERAAQYGYTSGNRVDTTGEGRQETVIPKVEESLEVGKKEVERGGVRVRSRIVEKPVEENVRLREEHIHVERQPVNRPVTDADRTALQDRDIELTEHAEVPVVNKEARVVEEVRVGKEVNERTETVRDTVRSTEIDIDKINSNETRDNSSNDPTDTRGAL